MNSSIQRRQLLAAAVGASLLPGTTQAQGFPNKPIQLHLPFPPGASFDTVLRALCDAAAADLGQPVIIQHKPGAGGVTAVASVAMMGEADGHTLSVMHNTVLRTPFMQKVNWDPLKDLSYVCSLAGMNTGIVVAANAPWKTLGELLADAKARPGIISWGNVGALSVNRITGERLAASAGAKFNMVPFKGGAEAFQALLGGHLDVYGDPGFGPMAISGKVRLLASFTEQRLRRWPQVATVKELGHDLSVISPIGLVAPKGLNPAVAARLEAAFRKAAESPAYQRLLDEFDWSPRFQSGAEFRSYAVAQSAREKQMLDQVGFKPE